jgi:hypothetical protein
VCVARGPQYQSKHNYDMGMGVRLRVTRFERCGLCEVGECRPRRASAASSWTISESCDKSERLCRGLEAAAGAVAARCDCADGAPDCLTSADAVDAPFCKGDP